MTLEKRAAILAQFRSSLAPPPAPVITKPAPTRPQHQRPAFIPHQPSPNPDHTTPDRAAELAAQERFLAERGAIVLPPSNDPDVMNMPEMTFDHHTKKWTRRANALMRSRANKQAAE